MQEVASETEHNLQVRVVDVVICSNLNSCDEKILIRQSEKWSFVPNSAWYPDNETPTNTAERELL